MSSTPPVSVIIPVFRGETYLPRLLDSIRRQHLQCDELWLVVTDSSPEIEALAQSAGARHLAVDRTAFDHAGTRSEAATAATGEVLVFLTQDVLPTDEATLGTLVDSLLADEGIGAAYGRQIPDEDVEGGEQHHQGQKRGQIGATRLGEESSVRSLAGHDRFLRSMVVCISRRRCMRWASRSRG